MTNNKDLFDVIKTLIIHLRRKRNVVENWKIFETMICENIGDICSNFDTRWLVSIADTYIDYGNSIEKRNAMFITLITNLEKLWATKLLMYDIQLNNEKLARLKDNTVVPLWDGMYSFNINHGDMSNNMFNRLQFLMTETPALNQIYITIIRKLIKNQETTLGTLNLYHKNLLAPPTKRSVIKILIKKIRNFLKQYRLFLF